MSSISIHEFLKRKGAIGLLVAIHNGSGTFTEIKSEMDVSQTTLSKRKDEAKEIDLLAKGTTKKYDRTTAKYELTQRGHKIAQRLNQTGIARDYVKMRTYQERFAEGKEQISEWAEANAEELLRTRGEADLPSEIRQTIREDPSPDPDRIGKSESPPREQLEDRGDSSSSDKDAEDGTPAEYGEHEITDEPEEDGGEEITDDEETESNTEEDTKGQMGLDTYEGDGKWDVE